MIPPSATPVNFAAKRIRKSWVRNSGLLLPIPWNYKISLSSSRILKCVDQLILRMIIYWDVSWRVASWTRSAAFTFDRYRRWKSGNPYTLPEFILLKKLFKQNNINAVICDPSESEFVFHDQALWHKNQLSAVAFCPVWNGLNTWLDSLIPLPT